MVVLESVFGAFLVVLVLWEGFETIVLPRRVTRRVRMTRLFYRFTWRPWSKLARLFGGRREEALLSIFGPLSLILLLLIWASCLVVGFAFLHLGCGSGVRGPGGAAGFLTDLYLSGTTFFTLGLGDVVPITHVSRVLTVVESGLGFGFLALVIGYIPAITQSFSRREVSISLLDARAGSPPTASEMLCRHGRTPGLDALRELLHDWEQWAAELMESHLSYPVLAYFRSQHDNQSWLGALTAVLDTSALVVVGVEGACRRQAELTFAMARHAVTDLALVLMTPPKKRPADRLPPELLQELRDELAMAGLALREGEDAEEHLKKLRGLYEPYIESLSRYLRMPLPPWVPSRRRRDNWQATAWELPSSSAEAAADQDETAHF